MSSVDDDAISRRLRGFPEIDARVREIPPEIATEWPGARRVSLALGDALRLSLPLGAHAVSRLEQAASRLVQEPAVQEAARHTAAIAARADHWPEGRDRDEWRRLTFEGEARDFAAAHHFSYLSPRDVRRILTSYFAAIFRGEDEPPSWHVGPTMYVNPLADTDLTAQVPPGHILVDLTHATTIEDLLALRPHLKEAQRRLRYERRDGGRNADCVNRIRLVVRQFHGVEPPGSKEVARLVYGSEEPEMARDAYRKCLKRNNKRHQDILREEGWGTPDR